MKLFRLLFLLPAGLWILLSGCATTVDPKDENLSMIYGYIDMSAAPSVLKEVSIREDGGWGNVDTAVERNAWTERGGMFWHLGVEPGSYQIHSFGDGKNRYKYGKDGQSGTTIRIEKPGIYFMGSYAYTIKSKQTSGSDGFDLKPTASQHEVELLERLIKIMESKKDDKVYVRQYGWLKKRLSELKR